MEFYADDEDKWNIWVTIVRREKRKDKIKRIYGKT